MSRGHGATQLRILRQLAEHRETHPPMDDFGPGAHPLPSYMHLPSFLSIYELAANKGRGAVESARSATKRLASQGLVELDIRYRDAQRTDGVWTTMPTLCARLVLTEEDQARWDKAMAPRLEQAKRDSERDWAIARALLR